MIHSFLSSSHRPGPGTGAGLKVNASLCLPGRSPQCVNKVPVLAILYMLIVIIVQWEKGSGSGQESLREQGFLLCQVGLDNLQCQVFGDNWEFGKSGWSRSSQEEVAENQDLTFRGAPTPRGHTSPT